MKLDLTEIALNPGKRKDYIIDEEGLGSIDEVISEAPIKGVLKFTNTHGLIYAKGNFTTTVKLQCGRCLEYFDFPISKDIEEIFPIVTGEIEEDNYLDDVDFPVFENYILDLGELIRQYILVEVPTQPLCIESCKGLCVGCGANLNKSKCHCEDKEINNPFKDLLEKFDRD